MVLFFCIFKLFLAALRNHVFLSRRQAVIGFPCIVYLLFCVCIIFNRGWNCIDFFNYAVCRCLILSACRIVINFFCVGQLLLFFRCNIFFLFIRQAVIRFSCIVYQVFFADSVFRCHFANGVNFFHYFCSRKPVVCILGIFQFLFTAFRHHIFLSSGQAVISVFRIFNFCPAVLVFLYGVWNRVNLFFYFVCRFFVFSILCLVIYFFCVSQFLFLFWSNQFFLVVRQLVICVPGVLKLLLFICGIFRRHFADSVNFILHFICLQIIINILRIFQLFLIFSRNHIFLSSSQVLIRIERVFYLLFRFLIILYRN